ncbi:biosynthetic arginine decarboxylase [Ruficoccus amylovorans]|uniref:Arginine decarboxylase n=1 Tax=Ruficoccus amylovorans TaxID=1804625 RepID=A0A842HIC6_9BACT|nr:biosynthetic arginine decarboxylase [Ruficoccus amylovorans]MBC2596109.1 biosynthetic arginine decarboxylase [Ruficoccus amylovorans]
MGLQNGEQDNWSASSADAYYGFSRWGKGHFSVDPDGALCVHPMADARKIRLTDVLEEARQMGLSAPLTIRVQDLLRRRVVELNEAFGAAIEAEQYEGRYQGVFPIKVNQLREVVDEILDAGKPWHFGLEAGSKPELLIALAMLQTKNALLVCNGYKDADYIRLAMLGTRLGKKVVVVIEQPSEADMIIQLSRETGVTPIIGLRLKLSTTGEGRWSTSSGDHAKFGLSAPELVSVVKKLRRAGLKDFIQLVHFHIGSQVPSIITLKKAVVEAARFYCELHRMGLPMKYLDCGGGLGIDYDGSRSNFDSSANYSLQEYARDMVFNIKSVCESSEVPVPDIVTESGRALVALHSILIVEVVDNIAKNDEPADISKRKRKPREPQVLKDLREILDGDEHWTPLERFHDAQQKKEEAQSLFSLGYLDLESRAETERLYWEICRRLRTATSVRGYVPEELAELNATLAEQYVCNFSVFQSLLDHWALDQLFPIAPIHRLDEEPTVEATLVDITCDSDGKVNQFIDLEDVKQSLRLHPLEPGKPYHLGVFLVGAYQDIMGDLHNLFGRVNEVHVFLEDDEEDGYYIEETISGFTTDEVLGFIQHKGSDLIRQMKKQIDRATRNDQVKPREGVRMLSLYTDLIGEKTYLKSPGQQKARRRRKGS